MFYFLIGIISFFFIFFFNHSLKIESYILMLLRTLEKSLKISVVKLVKLKIDSDTEYNQELKKRLRKNN